MTDRIEAASADSRRDVEATLRPLNEVRDVAQYLRCGRTQVFALIRSGELASAKVGRKRVIPASAVEAYVARLLKNPSGPSELR